MSLLGRKFVGMASKRRKAHFSRRRNLRKHFFDPNLVYTFDFYQHILDMSAFEIKVGMGKYDLQKILGSKPIQFMAVAWDPLGGSTDDDDNEDARICSREPPASWPYLYNVEILHERSMVPHRDDKTPFPDHGQERMKSQSPKGARKRLLGLFSRKKYE